MKRNNLTFRFPSIFASEDKQDVLLCKPCEPKVSEGEGNKPIRTSRVTSSSTYPDETKVSKVEIELATDSQHPVSQEEGNLSKGELPNDYGESPRIRKKGVKWDDRFGSPVIWWDEKKDSEELVELSSNLSTKLSFEIDDLSEHKGSS